MCGGSTMRAMAPNANIQESQLKRINSNIPTGHTFDKFGAGIFKHAKERSSPKTRAVFEGIGKEQTPPVQRSAPSSNGGPTSLGIRRGSGSTRKRSTTSSRRTSKSKRFSTTR